MIVDDISMARHRMGGILTIIRESLSMVLRDMESQGNTDHVKVLSRANKNVDRLIRLANNYFLIQMLEAGIIDVNSKVDDLNKVAQVICTNLSTVASQKETEIVLKLDDKLPKTKFDSELMGIVIENLVSNAIDFTDNGTIVVTIFSDDESIRLSVADTGCGIDESEVSKLFHRFEKLSNNSERGRTGDGMGLAVSKEIMTKLGGGIWLESTSDKGSTFVISLPIRVD
ncbi:MAG: HAMP domain-containing sensor histidine kinase [Pseudomonadota bacterium]